MEIPRDKTNHALISLIFPKMLRETSFFELKHLECVVLLDKKDQTSHASCILCMHLIRVLCMHFEKIPVEKRRLVDGIEAFYRIFF